MADGDKRLPLEVDAFALGLVSLCDGVQFLRMCNPQAVTDEAIQSVLVGFLSWLVSVSASTVD